MKNLHLFFAALTLPIAALAQPPENSGSPLPVDADTPVLLETVAAKPRPLGDFGLSAEGRFSLRSFFSLSMDSATVHGVKAGSPAETAGLKEGELVIAVNGVTIQGMKLSSVPKLFPSAVYEGDTMTLLVAAKEGEVAREVVLTAMAKTEKQKP